VKKAQVIELIKEELISCLQEQEQNRSSLLRQSLDNRKQMIAYNFYWAMTNNNQRKLDWRKQEPQVSVSKQSQTEMKSGTPTSGPQEEFEIDQRYQGKDGSQVAMTQTTYGKPGSLLIDREFRLLNSGNSQTKTMHLLSKYLSPNKVRKVFSPNDKAFIAMLEKNYQNKPKGMPEDLKITSFDVIDFTIVHTYTDSEESKETGKVKSDTDSAKAETVATTFYYPIINNKPEPFDKALHKKAQATHDAAIKKYMSLTPSQISKADIKARIAEEIFRQKK